MATLIGSSAFQSYGSSVVTPGNPAQVTVTGANQSILFWLYQPDPLTRTFSVSSNVDGAFTEVAYTNPSFALGCWVLRDATVGAHDITAVASASGVSYGVSAQVIEGLGTATPVTDTQVATANTSSHVTGATGITTSTPTFVLCVCALSGNVTTKVPGTGYTAVVGPSATGQRYGQYQDFASGVTLEQGAFTTTGTSRANRGLLVGFPEAAGPGTPTAAGGAFIAWFGR